jgi:hypothetical protein
VTVRFSLRGETESFGATFTTLYVTGTFTVLVIAEEMATVPEYVPRGRSGFTETMIEVDVAPPPLTVNQLPPIAAAVICTPVGLLKTETPWAASAAAPCWYVKVREAGETVICAWMFKVTETEARAIWPEVMFTVPVYTP